MSSVLLHLFLGVIGSLGLFLLFTFLSGERRFSAPFVVLVVGLACATLSRYLSPWATPVILVGYGVAGLLEVRRDRASTAQGPRQR
ncbi:MAG: hypothetical protein HY704_05730 [Gemmatimonadetes bacterium]|nr:hypothetical protein [Gemmatimonadota bacterium]